MAQVRALRPMGLLEIVDQTFRLYRSNFGLFFGISAVVQMPYGLLQAAQQQSPTAAVLSILMLPVVGLTYGALTKAVSDRYMGEQATVGGAYSYIAKRFFPLLLTLVVAYLFTFCGFLLLIVGFFVFAFWITFVPAIFIIEDKRYFRAIWRSKFLIGHGVWAEVLVLYIITSILTGILYTPAYILMFRMMLSEPSTTLWLITGLLSGLAQSLGLPVVIIAFILLYYDSRIRKEGFDLEVLARELGKTSPQRPSPPPLASPQIPPASPQAPPAPPQ